MYEEDKAMCWSVPCVSCCEAWMNVSPTLLHCYSIAILASGNASSGIHYNVGITLSLELLK
jgi:hypothetical protein